MNNIQTAWLHHKTSKYKNISTEKFILCAAKVCFKTNTKINPSLNEHIIHFKHHISYTEKLRLLRLLSFYL